MAVALPPNDNFHLYIKQESPFDYSPSLDLDAANDQAKPRQLDADHHFTMAAPNPSDPNTSSSFHSYTTDSHGGGGGDMSASSHSHDYNYYPSTPAGNSAGYEPSLSGGSSVSPSPSQIQAQVSVRKPTFSTAGAPSRTPSNLRRARASSTPYGQGPNYTSSPAGAAGYPGTSMSAHASPHVAQSEAYVAQRITSAPEMGPPHHIHGQGFAAFEDPSQVAAMQASPVPGPGQGHQLFGSDGYSGSASEHSVTDEEYDSRRSSVASSAWSSFDLHAQSQAQAAAAQQQAQAHAIHAQQQQAQARSMQHIIHVHQPIAYSHTTSSVHPHPHSHPQQQSTSEMTYAPRGPAGSGMGIMFGRAPARRPTTTSAVANAYHPGAFGGVQTGHERPSTSAEGVRRQYETGLGIGGLGAGGMSAHEYLSALAHQARTAIPTGRDRARAQFVQAWLASSYEAHPDGRVSRQGLYGSYNKVCEEYEISAINSASFGKAVRAAFKGNIGTRRLGVRGNSKYHYVGIRPANDKEAERLQSCSQSNSGPEEGGSSSSHSLPQGASSEDERSDGNEGTAEPEDESMTGLDGLGVAEQHYEPITPTTARPGGQSQSEAQNAVLRRRPTFPNMPYPTPHTTSGTDAWGASTGWQAFADSRVARTELPNFEEEMAAAGTERCAGLDVVMARTIWAAYRDHVKRLMDAIQAFRFDQFERTLRTFWESMNDAQRTTVQHPLMMSLFYKGDSIMYDNILDFVHGHTLQVMPQDNFTALRQLAEGAEQIILIALHSYIPEFVRPKIELAARFGHLLLRHVGICSIASALQNILAKPETLRDMHEAWLQIDFEHIRNHCALVTNCQHDLLDRAFEDFRVVLADPSSKPLEHFINFVEAAYQMFVAPGPTGEKIITPRSLLIRWSFVTSQLMRELTLKSSPVFGAFQLLATFFEDWISFWTLRKVALHVGAVAQPSSPAPANDLFESGPSYLSVTPAPLALHQAPAAAASSAQAGPLADFQPYQPSPFSPRTAAAFNEALRKGRANIEATGDNPPTVDMDTEAHVPAVPARAESMGLDQFQSLSFQSPNPNAQPEA